MDWSRFLTGVSKGITETRQAREEETREFEQKKELIKYKAQFQQSSATEQFRLDLMKTIQGQDWDRLIAQYPEKVTTVKKLQPFHTPVTKSPLFKEGKGLAAFRSPHIAKLTLTTKAFIPQIKTQADLDELIERRSEAEAKGIDVDAILEYFGVR